MFLGPFRYGSGSLTQRSALFRVIRGRILKFGVTHVLCPHGDSNSGLSLERAPSWATRRWGHWASLTHVSDVVQTKRARLYPARLIPF